MWTGGKKTEKMPLGNSNYKDPGRNASPTWSFAAQKVFLLKTYISKMLFNILESNTI